MNSQHFTTSIVVPQSPAEVFDAVNKPKLWWSHDIEGSTDKLDDEWIYRFKDSHRSKIKVIQLDPGKKVVWLVEENYMKGIKDQSEWVGDKITFDISREGDKTRLVFTQFGLTPACECYDACNHGWTGFIQKSLYSLITTGKAQPKWYEPAAG